MADCERAQIVSPCAACKLLRRRCVRDKCVLAPYFPPDDPQKFVTAHRVFGACNIIKILQDLPMERRADAVSSMVYEASARLRDPVYGCAGAICQLQNQIFSLKSQVATAQAELFNMRLQQTNLLSLIAGMAAKNPAQFSSLVEPLSPSDNDECHMPCLLSDDDTDTTGLWDPFWP
uniref:TSA: Wollemia nobilis Ref_Wollemi_Transcript_26994_878 transcribed RNA sequence n=1 Tax=Wollemia nobilis TaxID=56998 RepID=A0A0C9RGJ0_9CONI